MSKRVVVVHDVLGTLFGLEAAIEELRRLFGEQVEDERFAELIVMDWYHAAQRDFMMLSVNGSYKPISDVFRASLPRVLLQAGLVSPSSSHETTPTAGNKRKGGGGGSGLAQGQAFGQSTGMGVESPFGEEVSRRMMASLATLAPRPGMQKAFRETYKKANVEVWGATNGGIALAKRLLTNALDGQSECVRVREDECAVEELQAQHSSSSLTVGLFSCDQIKVAKPDPRVYVEVLRRARAEEGDTDDQSVWFVASHTWDLFAARKAGFKTAWVAYEEFDMCKDIYGEHDVVGVDLNDVAQKIVQFERDSS